MAKFTYTIQTKVSPEKVWAALTEFGSRREEIWPDLTPGSFNLMELGETSAIAREGTVSLGIWVVEHYDWSQPGVVIAVSGQSNVVAPGGEWRTDIKPRGDGGTIITVSMDRRALGWRGRLLHGLFQVTGGRILAMRMRTMLSRLNAQA
ncbi:MAG: hypothetical protein QOK05_2325 [Chloroflexota bacterium]|jgi:hypothetical protein|nr:hypothetical protein [Chloroflexota bacterium]